MSFVELPSSTQLGVIALVSTLVALAITYLIAYAPWLSWLENYKEEWGVAAGLAVLEVLQNALPGDYPEASILAVQLALAVIAIYFGVKKFLISRGSTRLQ
jgi:hypothetical protein